MVDYKVTIKKIHSAIPELTTDELITIMDCIADIGVFRDNYLGDSLKTNWMDYKLTTPVTSVDKTKYSTSTKNSI